MAYVLENEQCRVECIERAGQIQHFLDKDRQVEIMYQGDQGWSGLNPTLFPIVGNTWAKDYKINGQTYAMKNHGLIRYADLQVKHIDKDTMVMQLDSNEETLRQYPFPFHYEVMYRLQNDTLTITYHITNTGNQEMPFTFGLHPGFQCPLCEEESFEDYRIRFSQPETMQQLVFDKAFKKTLSIRT